MDDLDFVSMDDLESRWSFLVDSYKSNLIELKKQLIEVSNIYSELMVIGEQLEKRGKEVNYECLSEEQKKIY